MKVFNEEATKSQGAIIFFENPKESRVLMTALEDFKKQYPRRKAAIKLIDQLNSKLGCW